MTLLFSDDFESGNLASWTTNGNPQVQSNPARTGQYACTSTLTFVYKTNYISKTGTAQTSSYLRFYVYFSVLPSAYSEVIIARCSYTSSRPIVTVYYDGVTHWRLRDGAGVIRQYDSGPIAQTWYCIELKAVVGDESALYLNGNKILVGSAPSGSSNTTFLMAYTYSGVADDTSITFDDVAYSDTYNGPQNLTRTVTDSLATNDPQLCNKQFLTTEYVFTVENAFGDKSLAILDHVSDQDFTAASKQLSINENFSLSEATQVGIRGHCKTKLFLFLADIAVQLTGD